MSTLRDVLGTVEEYQKAETEVPSAPVIVMCITLDPNSSEALDPVEFNLLIDFASDQTARWLTRWHFSPATSPDENALTEATAWQHLWERWADALGDGVPGTRELIARSHELACTQRALERAVAGHRSRAQAFAASLTSRIAILLSRIGLGRVARPLMRSALYPAGTVGRAGPPPLRDSEIQDA